MIPIHTQKKIYIVDIHLDLTASDTRQNSSSFVLQRIDCSLEFHAVRKKKKASLSEMGSQIKKPLITAPNNSKTRQDKRTKGGS